MQHFSESMELQLPVVNAVSRTALSRSVMVAFATRHWRIMVLVLMLLLLYGNVITELVKDWYKSGDDAHGFFVPPVVAYLIWRKRHALVCMPSKPSTVGLLAIVSSLALLFLGSLGTEFFLTRLSVVVTIAGLVLYFRGWRSLRILMFPLCFLLLMIPLPGIIYYQIVFPLQLLASRLATFGLERFNLFPVIREGNLLILPHYTLEVVEACSGVRSLMSLLTLSLGYGYLTQSSKISRAVLVLLVVPLAIVSNALRVILQALLVRYRGVDIAERQWHEITGLMTFIAAAMLLLVTARVVDGLYDSRPSHEASHSSH